MRKLIVAGIAAAAFLSAPALAGPPAAPMFNWTGFYVGGAFGYAWGKSFLGVTTGIRTNSWTNDGIVGGGTAGFNWQLNPNWVIGAEADFSGADVSGGGPTSGGFGCGIGCQSNLSSFGTARGRIGFAAGNVLYYGTGGYAYGRVFAGIPTIPGFGGSKDANGWAAGGGIEYALDQNWSAKVEYLRVDLGTFIVFNAGGCGGVGCNTQAKYDVVRIGLNYKFGSR